MRLLKAIRFDLASADVRHHWLASLVRNMPGEAGVAIRRRVFGSRFRKAGEGLRIFPGARIIGAYKLTVGRNCNIGVDNILQANGEIEIGDDVVLGPRVMIWSVNHVFTNLDVTILEQGYDHKRVVIGNGVWIGANSFIMPGANLGDHVVVSAGSVVAGRDVEPYSILAGNPARRIGTRLERAVSPAPHDGQQSKE
jgi:maltose O-acetyltransferase